MPIKTLLTAIALLVSVGSFANAQSVSTTFSQAEGFVTGSTADTTISDGALSAIFSGGFQEQSFDGPSYNNGPDAYFFVNGTFTGSFGGDRTGSTDVGTVTFNTGVDELSFFAADRANGTPAFRLLGTDGVSILANESITATQNNSAAFFSFDSGTLGGQIGSIEFDNAGPASNPPYVIAIDSFSASVNAIPEPSSLLFCAAIPVSMLLRRRRR